MPGVPIPGIDYPSDDNLNDLHNNKRQTITVFEIILDLVSLV